MEDTKTVETYMSPALCEALVRFHEKAIIVKEEGKANYGKYATYEQIIQKIRPLMSKESLFFQHISHPAQGGAAVETVIYGHGGQISSGIVRIPASVLNEHKYGGAISYAKRYSLNLALGLGGDPDPIEESAEEDLPTVVEARKPARKAAPKPPVEDEKAQRAKIWKESRVESAKSIQEARELFKTYEKACRNRGLSANKEAFEGWLGRTFSE